MEAKFGVEAATAVTRLNRKEANDLVVRLLEKYESQVETAPTGSTYQECYDVKTGKPGREYLRLYDEVKEELATMGIPFE
jgi:methylamine--corrinoid protein Co-methyltransferase